jgi:hypothetical protein
MVVKTDITPAKKSNDSMISSPIRVRLDRSIGGLLEPAA